MHSTKGKCRKKLQGLHVGIFLALGAGDQINLINKEVRQRQLPCLGPVRQNNPDLEGKRGTKMEGPRRSWLRVENRVVASHGASSLPARPSGLEAPLAGAPTGALLRTKLEGSNRMGNSSHLLKAVRGVKKYLGRLHPCPPAETAQGAGGKQFPGPSSWIHKESRLREEPDTSRRTPFRESQRVRPRHPRAWSQCTFWWRPATFPLWP